MPRTTITMKRMNMEMKEMEKSSKMKKKTKKTIMKDSIKFKVNL